MEHLVIVLIVAAFLMLVAAVGLNIARRQFAKKRKDYRMGQALRRGLAQTDGFQVRSAPIVQW